MYRRPKFLEILLDIRREMAAEADYDVDLFAERVRAGMQPSEIKIHDLAKNGDASDACGDMPEPVRKKRRAIRK